MHKDFVGNATKKRMPGIYALAIALIALAFAGACSKSSSNMSPTEVFKAYYDAAVKKDFATAKGYLSQGTLKLMEEGAKKQGKSVDEALKDSPAVSGAMPQMSNEKITGDTATVDITAEGQKVSMPFVKENGGWKIAMDKLFQNMMGALGDSAPPTTAPKMEPEKSSAPKAEAGEDKENKEGDHDGGH